MIKIGFFGTPELARSVLTSCIACPEFEVRYVVTQPDKPVGRHAEMTPSPVKVFAQGQNIPVFTPAKIRGNDEFFADISVYEVDYLVVVAYGKILPNEILALPKVFPVNVHGSILPAYRGASPIQSVLLHGESKTGVTIMCMSEGMDEGDMLAVREISIRPKETTATLFEVFEEISGSTLVETILAHARGEITPVPQDHSSATYCSKISKEDGKIDFTTSAIETFHKWQAYTPWPGIWCELDGKRCKVLDCEPTILSSTLEFWEASVVDGSVIVPFAQGNLRFVTIQLEGKTPVPAIDFVKSRGGKVKFA